MPDVLEPIRTVVVAHADGIEADTIAKTAPANMPNVEVVSLSWWQAIGIRAARTYLTTLTGLLSAKGIGLDAGVLPSEFWPAVVWACQVALAPAVMSILLNSTEILTKLDVTRPGLRA